MATLTSERIDDDRPLFDAGLDSLGTLELIEQFEKRFSLKVPPTLLYDHPTMRELVAYFALQDTACAQWRLPLSTPAQPLSYRAVQLLLAPGDRQPRPERFCCRLWLSASNRQSLALSIVPLLVLFDLSAGWLTTYQLLLMGPLWLALVPLTTMAVVLLFMRAVGRGSDPERELWGPEYFRWLFVHQLFRSVEGILGVLRGTAILRAFYRLGGATIGKDVQLDTVTLYDLECIHIGDQTIIGRDANFQPARVHAGKLAKQPIRIGSRCFIGPNSSLLGGADIPDGTNIRPLSAINSSVPVVRSRPVGSAPDLVEIFDFVLADRRIPGSGICHCNGRRRWHALRAIRGRRLSGPRFPRLPTCCWGKQRRRSLSPSSSPWRWRSTS